MDDDPQSSSRNDDHTRPKLGDFAYRRRNKKFNNNSTAEKNDECSKSPSSSGGGVAKTENLAAENLVQNGQQKTTMCDLLGEVNSIWMKGKNNDSNLNLKDEKMAQNQECETKNSATSSDDENKDLDKSKDLFDDSKEDDDSSSSSRMDEKLTEKRKKEDSDSDYEDSNAGNKEKESERDRNFAPNSDDDDEYALSSANSSDSEKKEWLNKNRLREKRRERKELKRRRRQETLEQFPYFKKRRQESSMENDSNRVFQVQSSLENLKRIRRLRLEKKKLEESSLSDDNNENSTDKILKNDQIGEKSTILEEEESFSSKIVQGNLDKSNPATSDSPTKPANHRSKKRCLIVESSDSDDQEKTQISNDRSNLSQSKKSPSEQIIDQKGDDSAQSRPTSSSSDDEEESSTVGSNDVIKKKRVILLSSSEDEDKNEASNVKNEEKEVEVESENNSKNRKITKPSKLNMNNIEVKVVKFFNDATSKEMISIPKCSDRIAEALIENRPFKNYDHLIEAIKQAKIKGLTANLVESYIQQLKCRNELDLLLYTCQEISGDLLTCVQKLTIAVDNDKSSSSKMASAPKLLQKEMQLKPYQIVGLNWLILMHKKNLNCILADEMGLGKTIQVISFLAYLKEKNVPGPHLVVVPSSTLDNWLNEFRRWCPSLNILTYYGSAEDRKFLRCDIYDGRQDDLDVLLSTYRVVTSSSDDRAFLKKVQVHYSIYDEAHMLKNCTTNRYKSLMKIKAKKRLLLTGTPLQNNLVELISLMHFVMPDLFYKHTENLRDLLALFQCKTRSMMDYEQEKIQQAKSIMKPFVLRRLKCEVLDQLPKKHEFVEYCHLIDNQLELYGNLVAECAEALKKKSSTETSTKSTLSNNDARCFIMQLRKAANHPLLLRKHFTDDKLTKMAKSLCKEKSHRDADPKLVEEDMSVMSDFELTRLCGQHKALNRYKLASKWIGASAKFQKLDDILPVEKKEANKVLLFSQFTMVLDIMEEYLKQKKYKYLRLDGQTPVVERQILIDQFNTNADLFVFLLSTKAGGLGINLTSANVIILHDIDYNPYNDRQAEDRCHRVGQTKEVKVLRLIAKNTIDETMLACARRKLDLEKQVTADEGVAETEDMESLLKQALMMV